MVKFIFQLAALMSMLTGSGITVAAVVSVNFDEVILPSVWLLDGTTFYDPYGISFEDRTYYVVDSRFAEDDYGISSSGASNNLVTVVFDDVVSYLDFSWQTITSNDLFATAYDKGGNVVDLFSVTGLSGTSTGTGLLTGEISKVTWNDGSGKIGIDSLRYETLVPVPASVWLLGSALGLLGWMRRKAA
jgi:hypothetical protein